MTLTTKSLTNFPWEEAHSSTLSKGDRGVIGLTIVHNKKVFRTKGEMFFETTDPKTGKLTSPIHFLN